MMQIWVRSGAKLKARNCFSGGFCPPSSLESFPSKHFPKVFPASLSPQSKLSSPPPSPPQACCPPPLPLSPYQWARLVQTSKVHLQVPLQVLRVRQVHRYLPGRQVHLVPHPDQVLQDRQAHPDLRDHHPGHQALDRTARAGWRAVEWRTTVEHSRPQVPRRRDHIHQDFCPRHSFPQAPPPFSLSHPAPFSKRPASSMSSLDDCLPPPIQLSSLPEAWGLELSARPVPEIADLPLPYLTPADISRVKRENTKQDVKRPGLTMISSNCGILSGTEWDCQE